MLRFLVLWPVLELAAFIALSSAIGFLRALGVVLLSTLAGLLVLQTGGRSLAELQQNPLDQAAQAMGSGLSRMASGWLLLIPGLLSSALGLLLFFPPSRLLVFALLGKWVNTLGERFQSRMVYMNPDGSFRQPGEDPQAAPGRRPADQHEPQSGKAPESVVIDVETVDDDK